MINQPKILASMLVFLLAGVLLGRIIFDEKPVAETKHVIDQEGKISLLVPAIREDGNGTVLLIKTYLKEGEGNILVDVNHIVTDVYLQESARLAAKVASNYSQVSIDNKDIFYSVETNGGISGPSAGASMTISTIALLENKSIRGGIMITGGINGDGKITPVGIVLEKAKVAKEAGMNLFLVAEGQSYKVIETNRRKLCTENESYCRVEYEPIKKFYSEEAKITIKEVKTIDDVANIMLR